MTAPSDAVLGAACAALARTDSALARAHDEIGLPQWRVTPCDYASLARLVAYQLISTKAAAKIWARVCDSLGEVTAEAVLTSEEDTLRACGLSRPKVSHMRAIADAVLTGALPLAALPDMDEAAARRALLSVRGIGPWTADVFLLSATGAVDAFPTGDVGHMEAYRCLSGAEERLASKAFSALAETWRPHRGVAAHLLWDWINTHRDRDTAPTGFA